MVIYHTNLLFHCTFRCNAHDLQYLIRILNMQKQRGRVRKCLSQWRQWQEVQTTLRTLLIEPIQPVKYRTSTKPNPYCSLVRATPLLLTVCDTDITFILIMVVIESWLVNRGLLLRDTISHNLAAASLSFPNQRLGVPFPSVVMATVVTTILMFVPTQTSSYHLKTKSTPC